MKELGKLPSPAGSDPRRGGGREQGQGDDRATHRRRACRSSRTSSRKARPRAVASTSRTGAAGRRGHLHLFTSVPRRSPSYLRRARFRRRRRGSCNRDRLEQLRGALDPEGASARDMPLHFYNLERDLLRTSYESPVQVRRVLMQDPPIDRRARPRVTPRRRPTHLADVPTAEGLAV